MARYEEDQNTILLPIFKEYWNNGNTTDEMSTAIALVNAYPGVAPLYQDTLTFQVYQKNGTQIGTTQTKTMDKYEQLLFLPSQFATSDVEAQQAGYVKITGHRPAAVALLTRIYKTTHSFTANGETRRTAIPSLKVLNFAINGTF